MPSWHPFCWGCRAGCTTQPQPPHRLLGEVVQAIVGADGGGNPAHKKIGQDLDDFSREKPPVQPSRQALEGEVGQHVAHPKNSAIAGVGMDGASAPELVPFVGLLPELQPSFSQRQASIGW